MKFSNQIIRNMSTSEYIKNRKNIQKFYTNIEKKKEHDKTTLDKSVYPFVDGKECKDCLDFKKWYEFYNNKSRKDGKDSRCKKCRLDRQTLRLKIDNDFRLISNLRKRLYTALKGKRKSDTTKILVGCSIQELKIHLESQFKEGMTWNNYGKWHVDHIIPCAKFDFSKEEDQHKCFHYKNLQPLWAIDNILKSSK